ncbi:MAG: FmdB family zinc ribbon protein, partial [Bdellovibrionota bacterium]
RCDACVKTHEVLQKFSDAPLAACPDCGAGVTKLMSLSGFALKGTGFYTTDYKRAAAPNSPKKTDTSASGATSAPVAKDAPASPAAAPAAPSAPSAPSAPAGAR